MHLSNEEKAALVRRVIEAPRPEVRMGEATALKCSCGGVLHRRLMDPPPKILPGPRRSKNRRIRKKQAKRWRVEYGVPLMAFHLAHNAMRPRGYVYAACKRSVGFYEAVGRNMFTIEPLPPGALPIYDRDPDVASIVLGSDAGEAKETDR